MNWRPVGRKAVEVRFGEIVSCHRLGGSLAIRPLPASGENDKDGVSDPDERLNITGVQSGTYDIKLADKEGRTCMVKASRSRRVRSFRSTRRT